VNVGVPVCEKPLIDWALARKITRLSSYQNLPSVKITLFLYQKTAQFLSVANICLCSHRNFRKQIMSEFQATYTVVINHEEQYSIWLVGKELPIGWREVGKSGSKQECLDYIEQVWVDMRPLSLRKALGE
jgi:MbtH protein